MAMSDYLKYMQAVAEFSREYMKPIVENNMKGTLVEPHKHKSFNTLFYGFTEIQASFEALKFSEILIDVAPPRSRRIKQEEYLKYIVYTYLQDVYILKERLNTYATKIKRLYSNSKNTDFVGLVIDAICGHVKLSLDSLVNVRGAHVHTQRYADDFMDGVSSMSLISEYNPELHWLYKLNYLKAKAFWLTTIRANNENTIKLLDHYFSQISLIVCINNSVMLPCPN